MDEPTNLHQGRRKRVKQKYVQHGADSFSDHEILELLLYYCYPRQDTNPIAHKMINKFDGLNNLVDADVKQIMNECGVTENVAILVSLVPKIAKRYMENLWQEKPVLDNTGILGEYAKTLFIGKKYECFYVICLNSQYALQGATLVHEGTIDSVAVYPRNLIEVCLRYNASYVVLAHNHPSGELTASKEDLQVTREIITALKVIDIKVVDHIIVAGNDYFSFSKSNLLTLL